MIDQKLTMQPEYEAGMHESTFQYLGPSEQQKADMQSCRDAAGAYAKVLERYVPEGPDKAYTLRKLREVGMWANVAITRHPDGSPRIDGR